MISFFSGGQGPSRQGGYSSKYFPGGGIAWFFKWFDLRSRRGKTPFLG